MPKGTVQSMSFQYFLRSTHFITTMMKSAEKSTESLAVTQMVNAGLSAKQSRRFIHDKGRDSMSEKEVILTRVGLKKLEDELEHLKSVKRKEIAERIKQAIEFGDISENSEYEDAKNEQAFIEGRIMALEKTLRNARLIEDDDIHTDIVSLGSRVVLLNLSSGKQDAYNIVASAESNSKERKISDESPVGRAIMGQPIGMEVEVSVPSGKIKYRIVSIEK